MCTWEAGTGVAVLHQLPMPGHALCVLDADTLLATCGNDAPGRGGRREMLRLRLQDGAERPEVTESVRACTYYLIKEAS